MLTKISIILSFTTGGIYYVKNRYYRCRSISIRYLNTYAQNPCTQVVAIADLNEDLVKERAQAFNIEKYYTDYRFILEDKEIDAISILTPTFTHCNIAVEALKAGKHVLCEKPPARTVKFLTTEHVLLSKQAVLVIVSPRDNTSNLLVRTALSELKIRNQLLCYQM